MGFEAVELAHYLLDDSEDEVVIAVSGGQPRVPQSWWCEPELRLKNFNFFFALFYCKSQDSENHNVTLDNISQIKRKVRIVLGLSLSLFFFLSFFLPSPDLGKPDFVGWVFF